MTTESAELMSRHPSASEYGRHALIEQPSDTQVYYGAPGPKHARPEHPDPLAHYGSQARQAEMARGLMSVAFAEMSAAARGLMALGVRG